MRRVIWRVAVAAWLAAAVVTWNAVFDRHVEAGARDYVDRQDAFVRGGGPRADMDATMRAAAADGLKSATLWTLLVLAPGLGAIYVRRR